MRYCCVSPRPRRSRPTTSFSGLSAGTSSSRPPHRLLDERLGILGHRPRTVAWACHNTGPSSELGRCMGPELRSDEDLLSARDGASFEVFYRRHAERMLGLLRAPHARRRAGRRPDGRDLRRRAAPAAGATGPSAGPRERVAVRDRLEEARRRPAPRLRRAPRAPPAGHGAHRAHRRGHRPHREPRPASTAGVLIEVLAARPAHRRSRRTSSTSASYARDRRTT